MDLDGYMRKDPRLKQVDHLAKGLYMIGGLPLHNYDHARWDTDIAIRIGEAERHPCISRPIASALMHDTGVSRGPYAQHAENGERNVRSFLPKIGFDPAETDEIATAVREHNDWTHSSGTSRILYDADALNKAGAHGIEQCRLVGIERNLSVQGMRDRFLPYFEKLIDKGLYTRTARGIDKEMGTSEYAGLELTLEFWKRIDALLKKGASDDQQMIAAAKSDLGV